MKICLFSMLTIFLMASVAGCSKDTKDPYGSHLSADGVCIGDLHGCPATFDLAQCRAAVGDVGACDGDHLLYTFAADVPGMLGDYPYWMCFYDGISKQLIGQRVCVDDFTLCAGSNMCADTPGTPNCDNLRVFAPECADAGAASKPR